MDFEATVLSEMEKKSWLMISRHIANVFEESELDQAATVAEFAAVQTDGPRQVERRIEFYNLDVIISVGYRVKSHRATQFRIWATQPLREYLKMVAVTNETCMQGAPLLGNRETVIA